MTKKYWNPLGDELVTGTKEEVEKINIALNNFVDEKRQEYAVNVRRYFRTKMNILLLAVVVVVAFFVLRKTGETIFPLAAWAMFFLFVWYLAINSILANHRKEFKKICSNMLVSMMTQENGWMEDRNAFKNDESWKKMANIYPGIFQKGDAGQVLTDMVWGFAGNEIENYPFWKSIFKYKVEYNKKNGQKYYNDEQLLVLAFKTKQKICNGYIFLQGMKKDWWNEDIKNITKKKLAGSTNKMSEMEMIEFNHAFYLVDSLGIEKDKVYQIFSAVAQRNMVRLWKACNGCSFLIYNNELWATFDCVSLWNFEEIDITKLGTDMHDDQYYRLYREKIDRLFNNFVEILDSLD